MTTINYSYKFNGSESPELDDFTLGFLFASQINLDSITGLHDSNQTISNEDLSYLSVMLMKKECEDIQKLLEKEFENIEKFNIDMSQIGFDYWQTINGKEIFYLKKLPEAQFNEITNSLKQKGNPCLLTNDDYGNIIFKYQNEQLQSDKEQYLFDTYRALASFSKFKI